MIQWRCPSCGEQLEAPEALTGHAIGCPHCKSTMRVPLGAFTASQRAEFIMPPRQYWSSLQAAIAYGIFFGFLLWAIFCVVFMFMVSLALAALASASAASTRTGARAKAPIDWDLFWRVGTPTLVVFSLGVVGVFLIRWGWPKLKNYMR